MRGNLAGAVYTSFTMESGAAGGAYATQTSGVLNDTQMDVDADGNYEIRLGGPAGRAQLAGHPRRRRPHHDPPLLRVPVVGVGVADAARADQHRGPGPAAAAAAVG